MKKTGYLCFLILLLLLVSCQISGPRKPDTTKTPNIVGNPSSNADTSNPLTVFHINFNLDETITCAAGANCDSANLPRISLYFRGNIEQSKQGNLSGTGHIIVSNVEACQTLDPGNSSCEVTGVSEGSFSISGQMEGNLMSLTLQIIQMPSIQVTYSVNHPSGTVVQDFTSTYTEEMTQVLENSGLVGKSFTISPEISTTSSAIDFEGSYSMGDVRTMHGFGGLIVINPDTPLIQPYTP